MSLSQVPSEILRLIAVNLGPDDLFHLAISSPQFEHIMYDPVICRKVLEVRLSLQLAIYSCSPGILTCHASKEHQVFVRLQARA